MQHLAVTREYAAPIERVWACYTDWEGWTRWAGVGRVALAREGRPDRNGVGCVRIVGPGPLAAHEEVRVFEAPHRMVYALVAGGVPIRDHEGEVTFEALADGGTRVTWRCRFASVIPGLGPPIRLGVSWMFARMLRRMAPRVS